MKNLPLQLGTHVHRAIFCWVILLSSCVWRLAPQSAVNSEGTVTDTPADMATGSSSPETALTQPAMSELVYQIYTLPNSHVHVVTIPPTVEFQIRVGVADSLATLEDLAESEGAIAAINAGFFDPQNGLTTSYVTLAGTVVADPQQNDRLIQNPDLQPYLPAILNRSEFRIYDCGGTVQYDITPHNAPAPTGCTLDGAVGAGPQLLPTMTGYEEGFWADNEIGERGRDALGSQIPNARSVVGIKADGTVIWAIASQLPDIASSTGMTLWDMAEFLKGLGVKQALNLDGGSSSSLSFQGETHYGRFDEAGNPIKRPIKSVLFVR